MSEPASKKQRSSFSVKSKQWLVTEAKKNPSAKAADLIKAFKNKFNRDIDASQITKWKKDPNIFSVTGKAAKTTKHIKPAKYVEVEQATVAYVQQVRLG
jgi:hypothetical protein